MVILGVIGGHFDGGNNANIEKTQTLSADVTLYPGQRHIVPMRKGCSVIGMASNESIKMSSGKVTYGITDGNRFVEMCYGFYSSGNSYEEAYSVTCKINKQLKQVSGFYRYEYSYWSDGWRVMQKVDTFVKDIPADFNYDSVSYYIEPTEQTVTLRSGLMILGD